MDTRGKMLVDSKIKCYKCSRICKFVCKVIVVKDGKCLYGYVYSCPKHKKWVWYKEDRYPSEAVAQMRSSYPDDPAVA